MKINSSRHGITRTVVAAGLVATLAACASAPRTNAMLDDARMAYDRAASDPQVASAAPVELRKAQQALQQAESALRAEEDTRVVERYAYLARQRAEVAAQAGKIARADQAVADAAKERDRILIEARTRDAEAERAMAAKARADAEAQRLAASAMVEKARIDAEAQRRQATAARAQAEAARQRAEEASKRAEAQLAAAQAAQSQAATARERAKTLEDQLKELQAKPTERGMVLTLGDVLFDTGRAQLKPGADHTIDQLAAFLREYPERTVEIEGYTDSTGSEMLNQVLSERRAIAVKNALADRGITANRISARGFGKSNPVASNVTAAGRQQNRRVEVVIPGNT